MSSMLFPRWAEPTLLEVFIAVCQKHFPIGSGHGVLPGADEIAERAIDQLVELGARAIGQALRAEKAIDRRGELEQLKLTARIGPYVLFSIGHEHWPRRAQRDQAVLIERQLAQIVIEELEVAAEPVR